MKQAEAVYDADLNEIFVTYETPEYSEAYVLDLNTKKIFCTTKGKRVPIPWPEVIPKEYLNMEDYLILIRKVFGALCSKIVFEFKKE